MDPVSPVFAVCAVLVAVITTYVINRTRGAQPDQGRFASIDGLRGYLAFFVFLHHSSIWYFFLRRGIWAVPPSNLYTHFGQTSVALFFMITGFLFFSKLIDARTRGIDFARLFVSRILRLCPLYIFAMALLFSIVAAMTHGTLGEPLPRLIKHAANWLAFSILDAPNLNGLDNTAIIVAGATWSLPYEWFFYLSLPLLALTVGVTAPTPYLVLAAIAVLSLARWHPETHHLASFLGGIAAAMLVRVDAFRSVCDGNAASVLVLALLATAVMSFPSAYGAIPLLLTSLAFCLIAGGCNLFRILVSPISRTLGEMAYSIYLLHGIFLFVVFTFVAGRGDARDFSPMAHWALITAVTPLLIFSSFATFRLIEHPAMQRTSIFTDWLRTRLSRNARIAKDLPPN